MSAHARGSMLGETMRSCRIVLVLWVAVLGVEPHAASARERHASDVVAPDPVIDKESLRRHVEHLASDAMRGRDSTSKEATVASNYIAKHLEAAGVEPHGTDGTWFQPFTIREPVLQKGNVCSIAIGGTSTSYAVEKDWNPFSVSAVGSISGEVVCCGYGISAPERSWDDYTDVDVKGKVVLVMRKDPGWKNVKHASFVNKLGQAAKRGAVALLLCNDPATTKGGGDRIGHWSASLGAPAGSGAIPYAFISQAMAQSILDVQGTTLQDWETSLRADGPKSFAPKNVHVALTTKLTQSKGKNARNVVGLLRGRDPELAHEVIVVGAHYDHVGLGLFGSAGGPSASGKIHNGADDNASGTSSLLELAAWFGNEAHRPRRSILFIAFTGEERGLLGSRHFVNKPTVPLADIRLMINMDMVGRCRDNKLHVGGVGTAKGLRDVVATANKDHKLNITCDPGGTAPTDSTSFFRKRIPVLFFFTMLHKDYHRPTDDVDTLDFDAMHRITELVRDTCTTTANRNAALEFTMPPRPRRPAFIGVVPSREPDPRGILVSAVSPKGPAQRAGVQPGDIVVSLAGQTVRTLQDLSRLLARLRPGKDVELAVLREDQTVRLRVVLGGRR